MKRYIADVQYNEEYRFAAECEDPQEFINHFIHRGRGSDLEIEDMGLTDTPLIIKINVYETDSDGDLLDKVAEWPD